MKQAIKMTLMSAALAAFALPVFAQSSSPTAPVTGATVQDRKENQQDRIAQGVKSGQLTARETAHLEKNEARINREVKADRAANGGKLTAAERKQVNRQQNRESRQIYRDKHNGRKQAK